MDWWSSVGWEGAPPHFIAHTTRGRTCSSPSIFVFTFCSFPSDSQGDTWLMGALRFSWSPCGCFADMWSVLTKHLRAKYDAAVNECVETDVVDLRKLQTGFTISRSAIHSCVR